MASVRRPPARGGRIHVKAERCDTCVFRPGNRMRLEPGRLADLVQRNIDAGAALVCHKTTYEQGEGEALCRGFVDAYEDEVPALRLAAALGLYADEP